MVRRIYATRLMGISNDERRLLEIAEGQRAVLGQARRIAEKYGVEVDAVLRRIREIDQRIQRYGLAAELRRFAEAHNIGEDEARMRYEAARQEFAL